jgi:hypothetical protein
MRRKEDEGSKETNKGRKEGRKRRKRRKEEKEGRKVPLLRRTSLAGPPRNQTRWPETSKEGRK